MSKNRLNIFLSTQKTKLQGHKNDSKSNIKWRSQSFTLSVYDSLRWVADCPNTFNEHDTLPCFSRGHTPRDFPSPRAGAEPCVQ